MKLLAFVLDHVVSVVLILMGSFVVFKILGREKHHNTAKKALRKTLNTGLHEPLTLHPEVDPALCAGCGTCTRVCPEGDILQLINHKAVLVSPTKCVGHGECEQACPMGAISLVFGTKTRGMDIPRLTSNYETNVPGLYIAGELGGMGLIRNAIKQGALAAQHAILNLGIVPGTDCDVLIVGAGPAGISASLTAISKGKKYICIEQNAFGGTIANFPRQKVVMSHPIDLPIIGKKQFPSNKISKEELLSFWSLVKSKTGLTVQDGTRFEGLEKVDNIFKVRTSRGEIRAQKVILGLGVRGSPRHLDVPGEDLTKVTYNLIDPEQYKKQNIVIVGGGNAAVEAAQMLAKETYLNKVHLLVRGKAFDRCNEDNLRHIEALQSKGLVQIWFQSAITKIKQDSIFIKKGEQAMTLPNDFVFIFAGADTPHKFLMGLGIQIDKKFGEGLRKSA